MSLGQHFPGITPRAIDGLTFTEWCVYATASDQFDEDLRRERARNKR